MHGMSFDPNQRRVCFLAKEMAKSVDGSLRTARLKADPDISIIQIICFQAITIIHSEANYVFFAIFEADVSRVMLRGFCKTSQFYLIL